MRYRSQKLLAATILALSLLAANSGRAAPGGQPRAVVLPKLMFGSCTTPEWPKAALRDESEGVVELGFMVRPNGSLARSLVLSGTGDARLDEAALDAIAKCRFAPGTVDGKAASMWLLLPYFWTLEDKKGTLLDAALAAVQKGGNAGQYRLAMLYLYSDVPEHFALGMQWLRQSAAGGNAMAQLKLAQRLFQSNGSASDRAEAMSLFQASAKQGNVLAIERLGAR